MRTFPNVKLATNRGSRANALQRPKPNPPKRLYASFLFLKDFDIVILVLDTIWTVALAWLSNNADLSFRD